MNILVPILFCLGGIICVMNFYLSFLRYPVFLLRGGRKSEFQWMSGAPLIGSLSVAVGLGYLYETGWILVTGPILILMDTGGLHWFLGTMLYQWISRRDETAQTKAP